MDILFLTVTWFGSLYLLAPLGLLLAAMLWYQQRAGEALLLVTGLAGASLVCHGLKIIFARPRPPIDGLLVTMPSDFSFPSAHTAQAVAFALACWLIFHKGWVGRDLWLFTSLLVTVALAVGVSRIYLKVHYISDVLAGSLLGCLWVLLVYRLLGMLSGKG